MSASLNDLERQEKRHRADESPEVARKKPPPSLYEVESAKFSGFVSVLQQDDLSELRISSLLRELENVVAPPIQILQSTNIGNVLKTTMKRWRDDGHTDAAGRAKTVLRKWRESSVKRSPAQSPRRPR